MCLQAMVQDLFCNIHHLTSPTRNRHSFYDVKIFCEFNHTHTAHSKLQRGHLLSLYRLAEICVPLVSSGKVFLIWYSMSLGMPWFTSRSLFCGSVKFVLCLSFCCAISSFTNFLSCCFNCHHLVLCQLSPCLFITQFPASVICMHSCLHL